MRRFESEVLALGMNNNNYPGAFTEPVEAIIKSVIYGKVLHLYSGSSLIGEERIDLGHLNATKNCRVEDFLNQNDDQWDWCILDPPYAITMTKKLEAYAETASLSCNVKWRNSIKLWFQAHVDNILWLDYCAPMIKGFHRQKLWFLLPGGYHSIRVLSWLKCEMKPLL